MGLEIDALNNRPEIYPDLMDTLSAFYTLCATRKTDMGAPMSFSMEEIKIVYYLHNIEFDMGFRSFVNLILLMDRRLKDIYYKEQKEREKQSKRDQLKSRIVNHVNRYS